MSLTYYRNLFHTAVPFAFHVVACYVNIVPDDTPASLSQGKGW